MSPSSSCKSVHYNVNSQNECLKSMCGDTWLDRVREEEKRYRVVEREKGVRVACMTLKFFRRVECLRESGLLQIVELS